MAQGRLGQPTVLERLFLTANAAEPQAGSWGEAAAVATRGTGMAAVSRATLEEINRAENAALDCIHAYGKIIDNLQASKRLQAIVDDQATDSQGRSQFGKHIADIAVQVANQVCDLNQQIEIEYHYRLLPILSQLFFDKLRYFA